jgi:hypothetical protein
MKVVVCLFAVGLSILCGASLLRTSRTVPPRLRNTAMKSVAFVPVEAPDCVLEVSAGPQASLSAPVELIVTLANKGACPITYFVTTEAFTIAVRNLGEGKECPPTERGRTSFAWPRTGTLLRNHGATLPPGDTRAWKVDLREYFQLSRRL